MPALGGAIFLLLSLLVQLRVLAGIDLTVARLVAPLGNEAIDTLGEWVAVAVSAEVSLIYAALGAALLWRAGVGRLAVTPFGFLLLEPIELLWKLIVNQPPVPDEFYRRVAYPLTTLVLNGSFPSGHAMRSAFFCVFLGVVLAKRGGWPARIGPALCVVVALLFGFTRIYLGYHWFSDVIAGLVLGGSLALFVAPLVVRREGSGLRPSINMGIPR